MLSKIYAKGQIVIPAMLRNKYGFEIGETVEIIPEKGYLKLKKNKSKGLMDLAGVIETDKKFPSKDDIKDQMKKVIIKRNVEK